MSVHHSEEAQYLFFVFVSVPDAEMEAFRTGKPRR
jgi:hypothetical protein